MKHTLSTKFRRVLALTLMLLMIASLGGCWKKDDSDSTEPESTPPAMTDPIETTTEATTTAPTDPPTEPTTEAPTEEPTEAPTEPNLEGIKGTVTAASLKIRKGAGSEYQSIGTYSKGDQIELLEIVGDWGRTSKGWVSMDYVQINGSTNNKDEEKDDDKTTTSSEVVTDGKTTALGYGVVNLGALNVRTGPGTKYDDIGNVTLGNRYAYYQKSGNWVRIKDGWISLSYFYVEGNTGDGAGTGTITADLNIRSGPSKNYDRVGSYKEGESVKILTQINKWGYTGKGWISMSYVKMDGTASAGTTGKGTVTASELNIRKEPSTESDKVGVYKKGDKIEILEVKGSWGRTDKGWVSLDYVRMDESTPTTTYKTGKGTVTASSLYIRKKADKNSDIVGAYFKDDKVEILEVSGKWGRTDKGWISLDYVKMDETAAKIVDPIKKGTVTASSLYIRKEPTTSSEAVGAYSKGDKVEILEMKDGWGRTDKGWIYLDYVKLDS